VVNTCRKSHLLDHRQPIRSLDAGSLQPVVELRILVGGEVEARGLAHDLDADVMGVAVGEQRIGVVDGTGEDGEQEREADFGRNDPPEISL
jgi:hypothetical protein